MIVKLSKIFKSNSLANLPRNHLLPFTNRYRFAENQNDEHRKDKKPEQISLSDIWQAISKYS